MFLLFGEKFWHPSSDFSVRPRYGWSMV
jgi:hypothetical protein